MRLIVFLTWAVVAVAVLWLFVRRRPLRAAGPGGGALDELVKDPVCHTYIVRSRAVRRDERGETHFFCSDTCARRYLLN